MLLYWLELCYIANHAKPDVRHWDDLEDHERDVCGEETFEYFPVDYEIVNQAESVRRNLVKYFTIIKTDVSISARLYGQKQAPRLTIVIFTSEKAVFDEHKVKEICTPHSFLIMREPVEF